MTTVSDPGGAPRLDPKSARRRQIRLWILLLILPAVAAPLAIKSRWDGFREERIEHERNAADYARAAAVYRKNIEMYAAAADVAEKAAEGLSKEFDEVQRKDAEARRGPEVEARAQETYYLKKSGEEKRLAERARKRW